MFPQSQFVALGRLKTAFSKHIYDKYLIGNIKKDRGIEKKF